MSGRQDAIVEVVDIIRREGLTIEEVAAALKDGAREEKAAGVLSRTLNWVGGIIVFAGLSAFIGMQWDVIGAVGRIMLTLGVGFCVFVMGVTAARNERLARAATPLFIVASLLEPVGIMVAMREFSRGGDPAEGLLFMNLVMLAQQGLAFVALRRTFLALSSVLFGTGAFVVACDLLGVDGTLVALAAGAALLCLGWALGESRHRAAAGVVWFFGGAGFLCAAYDFLHRGPLEILFPGLACGMVYLSTVARSRALLTLGTVAVIGYIGEFTARHFAGSVAWPFVLMFMGLVLIGLSAVAVKINKKYIRGT